MTSGAILDAAEGVFAEQGLQGARMEDIAVRAGVAVGTLYNYFSDRQTLLAALQASREQQLFGLIDAALAAEGDPAFEALLTRTLRALLGHFDAHQAFFGMLVQGDSGPERAEVMCAVRRTVGELFARFDRLMARGVDAGVLRPADAPLYAAAVFGLLKGVALQEHITSAAAGVAERAETVARLFLDGARARCPSVTTSPVPTNPSPKDTP
ncbi:MAG: TetR family transcriptional regulator [Myxococcaceae bacterium]|nr:TetR family transcriptional regulator [Myxococcaceae bacterium]